MKKIITSLSGRILLLSGALALALSPTNLHATPYASGVTNNNGTVQFILNESGGTVKVQFDNNTSTINLGALSSGPQSFSLGTHSNYSIVVSKTGAGSWSQISVDTTNNSFYGPRGVAVNRNPQRPNFGRVYVANAAAGTGSFAPGRAVGQGIYIMNADTSDALGRYATASSGGIYFGAGTTTYSPYKIFVGPDDMVYVGSALDDFFSSSYTVGSGSVSMVDPAVTIQTPILNWTNINNTGVTNFGGCISTPFVTGSLASGNLQLWCNMFGYADSNGYFTDIYGYNVGGTLPCTSFPSTNAVVGLTSGVATADGVLGDLYIATNGYFFALNERSSATGGNVGLFVYSNDCQTILWDSCTAVGGTPGSAGSTALDPMSGIYGVAVSPDDEYVACVHGSDGAILLAKLTNGIPDVTTLTTNATVLGGTARGVAWDAADNVYVVSGGNDRLRAFSLGLTTTATTYNDKTSTNGTFSLVLPPTTITVVATANAASQSGPTPGVFTITRAGQNINLPLTVGFVLSGTAASSIYTASPAGITPAATNYIIFAANQISTNVTITPINDGVSRPTTTVVLSLLSGTNYSAVVPNQDTVNIQNTGPQLVFISAVPGPTMYNAFSNATATFIVTRWGDTNAASYTVNFNSIGGTAISNVDYTPAGPITFNPGDLSYPNTISPLSNGQLPVDSTANPYVGNKTAIIAVQTGGGVSTLTGSNAVITILDSANPTTAVLWADPLTDPNDGPNWITNYANCNMLTDTYTVSGNSFGDFQVNWGWDLLNGGPTSDTTDYGSISLPPSGATTALRVTVNKNGIGGVGAAAGVNLYPKNHTFSGNHAMRFSMNLIEGFNLFYTTEGALCGINHSGMATNWLSDSGVQSYPPTAPTGWESDGVWYYINADIGTAEYQEFTGLGGSLPNTGWQQPAVQYISAFLDTFTTNIYTGGDSSFIDGGTPENGLVSNGSPELGAPNNNWSDVEIKTINNVVTMSIDKTPVFVYTNTTSFTNGTIMLGYNDPYSSIGGIDASAYFSNLRVVSLAGPSISQIAVNHANNTAVINFTTVDGDTTAASFVVQTASAVNGPYTTSGSATITPLSAGAYQAVVPQSGAVQFYRILQQ